jgi:hypothetical protein
MTKKELEVRLAEACEFYCDLVWYARRDKTDPDTPGHESMKQIQREHRAQVSDLQGENYDWHHGFNSGCLATVRLALGFLMTSEDADLAEQEFPDLDT